MVYHHIQIMKRAKEFFCCCCTYLNPCILIAHSYFVQYQRCTVSKMHGYQRYMESRVANHKFVRAVLVQLQDSTACNRGWALFGTTNHPSFFFVSHSPCTPSTKAAARVTYSAYKDESISWPWRRSKKWLAYSLRGEKKHTHTLTARYRYCTGAPRTPLHNTCGLHVHAET